MKKPRRVWVWVWVMLLSWLPAAAISAAAAADPVTRTQPSPAEQKAKPEAGKKPDSKIKPEPKFEPKAGQKADKKPEERPAAKEAKKPDAKPGPEPKATLKTGQKPEPKGDKRPEQKPEPKAVPRAVKKPIVVADEEEEAPAPRKAVKKTEKKAGQKEKKPAPKAAPAPPPEAVKPPPPDEGLALLARAREKESAGDTGSCLLLLTRFINVFPRHPDRAATLMRMGRLAQGGGQVDKALQIFSLGASLYPDSLMAGDARWQAVILELHQDLKDTHPLLAFKNFLNKAALLQTPPEKLREPALLGWREVEKMVRQQSPCPAPLMEEVLALWEAHPGGSQPPEAALLLGEALLARGLQEVAAAYLHLARDQGSPPVRAQALAGLLETAWDSRDLQAFAGVWKLWRENRVELTPALRRRLEKIPLPPEFLAGTPGKNPEKKQEEDAVAALIDWWSGKTPEPSREAGLLACLEHFLRRPLSGMLKERLQGQLASLAWSQGNFARAARIYQELLADRGSGDNTVFYQDRLALARLKSRRPEEALEIFHGLGQGEDVLAQLLSRTRLADVELGRLQTEPLPND